MTTPQLLQQAKQGDPDAIAHLMNQSLEAKGIKAIVSRQGDRLRVLLNSENELNQTLLTQFIHKGIQNLNIPDITAVEVTGQSQASSPWGQTLVLKSTSAPLNPPPPSQVSSQIPSQAPPQPPQPPQSPQPPAPQDMTAVADPIAAASLSPNNFQDDLDLSAATLDTDFSLDDELSMAEIDQIVAEAVKEVTTKIQSEIPFDPSIDTENDTGLYGRPNNTAESISDVGIPTDESIRQAMQTDNLETFIEQELALTNAVTAIEQDETPPTGDMGREADFQSLPEDTGAVDTGAVDTGAVDTDDSSSAVDFTGDTPVADRVDMAVDDGLARPSATDQENPASRALLTLVSLITFGSIAALLGYSLQAYASNEGTFFPLPPNLSVRPENESANTTEETGATDETTVTDGTSDGTSDGTEANGATVEVDGGDQTAATGPATEDADRPSDASNTEDESPSTPADEVTPADSDAQATAEVSAAEVSAAEAIANLSCPDVVGGSDVTVSQITLNPDVAVQNETYPVMGCLTNHTDTPIISAVIKYQGQPTEAAADIVPQDEWSLSSTNEGIGQLTFDDVPPQSTVMFITQFPVAKGTTSINLKSLAWRPDGWSGEAKTLTLNFSIPLTDAN